MDDLPCTGEPARPYDFTGLTVAQQRLLTFQGWPCGEFVPKPRRSTVQPLIDRGLVVLIPRRVGGIDPARYDVPISVHCAWCMQCSGAV